MNKNLFHLIPSDFLKLPLSFLLCLTLFREGYHQHNPWPHQSTVSERPRLIARLWSNHSDFPVSLFQSLRHRSIWSQSFGRKLNSPPVNYLTYCCLQAVCLKNHKLLVRPQRPVKPERDWVVRADRDTLPFTAEVGDNMQITLII